MPKGDLLKKALSALPERLGAVFVDWDNLVIPTEMDQDLDISEINIHLMQALLNASLRFIDKAHLFVFTSEGNINRNYFLEVDAEEFDLELIVVPSTKDAADEAIRLKAEELMDKEDISTFIFGSGDGYFIDIARKLKQAGKKVIFMPYSKDNFHNQYRNMLDPGNIVFLKPYIIS